MSYVGTTEELWVHVSAIVEDEGLELYDLERPSPAFLRAFVSRLQESDSTERAEKKQAGVTSGDCSRLLRRLQVFFEAHPDRYGLTAEPKLEVSSPGVNRHLRLPQHFQSAIGENVRVSRQAGEGEEQRKETITGTLLEASEKDIRLADTAGGNAEIIALAHVSRARVEFEF